MIRARRRRRAFAMVAVIGVMAILVVLLVAVQSSVQFTNHQAYRGRDTLARLTAIDRILAMVGTSSAPINDVLAVEAVPGAPNHALVQRRPLGADDPVWGRLPGVTPLPGDVLVVLRWLDAEQAAALGAHPGADALGGELPEPARAWVLNTERRRRGAIELGRPLPELD